MIVNNHMKKRPVTEIRENMVVQEDGSTDYRKSCIVREHHIQLWVNEKLAARLVCTASDIVELIIGRLVTEGFVQSTDEIVLLEISEDGDTVSVILKDNVVLDAYVEQELTSCTGNKMLLGSRNRTALPVLKKAEWNMADIFKLAQEFASGSVVHRATNGTHSCYLSYQGTVIYAAEDLGRHNALDKVIGYAVLRKLNLAECMVYTTGRIPTDMVSKVIRAGIPILVSKSVPTEDAVLMAKQYHLTLICKAWPDNFEIYS